MNYAPEKLKKALVVIAEYVEKKKPKTFEEAEHMLALIGVIASETLIETKNALRPVP